LNDSTPNAPHIADSIEGSFAVSYCGFFVNWLDASMFRLLNSQKQVLYNQIQQFGLNPQDFQPSEFQQQRGSAGDGFRYRGTDFYFAIFPNESHFHSDFDAPLWISFSPGPETYEHQNTATDFTSILSSFAYFLHSLKRELSSYDPWAGVKDFEDTILSLPQSKAPKGEIPKVELEAIWKALGDVQATLLRHVDDDGRKHRYIKDQFRVLKAAG